MIIGYTWPEPESTAAGNRMHQLLLFFLSLDYKIVFASTAKASERSLALADMGIETKAILLNDPGFDRYVARLQPEVVLFDRFLTEEQFGWRVAEFAPGALRILDTEDLHSLRAIRERNHKKGIDFSLSEWLKSDVAKRELASIYRSDLSLIISSYEMELLSVLNIDDRLLLHLPFMVETLTDADTEQWPSYSDRSGFVCIGNGKHQPNIDALRWLKSQIWPRIKKGLPEAKLNVYGAYLPQSIMQMHHAREGFLVKGWVEDADSVMKMARLNLAPLRFGAGIKGKLLLGMTCGTPSVTTSIGAEGMCGTLAWNGKIEDDAEGFARAAIHLYENECEWKKAQEKGVALVNGLYGKERHEALFKDRIQALSEGLEEHRLRNLTGSLLQHHTLNATKYMAKWIEEKKASGK
ncbi:Glycosyltransferase involved in cell wall bisynthesis [Pseudozobellia thermophila]|uniref:Glycosyltransferase involved in cell wall bisynthesis n=1 Tax=Pseudozobellia thermophila TaxID=192903 RepID=A0A1M6ERU3_9FLAO|nr:Glycosyltransferase involved in cell wall bisynthesis [Pseudozobellia thermophila]